MKSLLKIDREMMKCIWKNINLKRDQSEIDMGALKSEQKYATINREQTRRRLGHGMMGER